MSIKVYLIINIGFCLIMVGSILCEQYNIKPIINERPIIHVQSEDKRLKESIPGFQTLEHRHN